MDNALGVVDLLRCSPVRAGEDLYTCPTPLLARALAYETDVSGVAVLSKFDGPKRHEAPRNDGSWFHFQR